MPLLGFSKPAIKLSRVDLPEPEVPRIQHISPGAISKDILSRATIFSFPTL